MQFGDNDMQMVGTMDGTLVDSDVGLFPGTVIG